VPTPRPEPLAPLSDPSPSSSPPLGQAAPHGSSMTPGVPSPLAVVVPTMATVGGGGTLKNDVALREEESIQPRWRAPVDRHYFAGVMALATQVEAMPVIKWVPALPVPAVPKPMALPLAVVSRAERVEELLHKYAPPAPASPAPAPPALAAPPASAPSASAPPQIQSPPPAAPRSRNQGAVRKASAAAAALDPPRPGAVASAAALAAGLGAGPFAAQPSAVRPPLPADNPRQSPSWRESAAQRELRLRGTSASVLAGSTRGRPRPTRRAEPTNITPIYRHELLNIVGPEAGDADGTLRRLSAALGIAPRVGREAYHRDYARLNPGAFFRTSYTGRTGADTFPLTPRR
jgi:hypothetical protein